MDETPFDSVESAHRYVSLLADAIAEAREEIKQDTIAAVAAQAQRQLEALRLVEHKLAQLATHVHSASRILNDLTMLRRLLLGRRDED